MGWESRTSVAWVDDNGRDRGQGRTAEERGQEALPAASAGLCFTGRWEGSDSVRTGVLGVDGVERLEADFVAVLAVTEPEDAQELVAERSFGVDDQNGPRLVLRLGTHRVGKEGRIAGATVFGDGRGEKLVFMRRDTFELYHILDINFRGGPLGLSRRLGGRCMLEGGAVNGDSHRADADEEEDEAEA